MENFPGPGATYKYFRVAQAYFGAGRNMRGRVRRYIYNISLRIAALALELYFQADGIVRKGIPGYYHVIPCGNQYMPAPDIPFVGQAFIVSRSLVRNCITLTNIRVPGKSSAYRVHGYGY